jgi:hypothetical protein
MNPTEIEFALHDLVATPFDAATFPYELLRIYNAPALTVSKLRSGQTNAAKQSGDVLAKKHLFYRSVGAGIDVAGTADAMLADPLVAKHNPRFVLVTDGTSVHIRDRKTGDTCNTQLALLDDASDFLLPLAGPEFERHQRAAEYLADIRATKRLRKLYDAILAANPGWGDGNHAHELNLFMTRVLFCLYAESTGILTPKKLFTTTLIERTSEDGSDVAAFLDRVFRLMNVDDEGTRAKASAAERRFPYVNGSLFEQQAAIPTFDRTARRLLYECSEPDWTSINPDIFGSMIQTIANDGARAELGMHYTSTENIMKVLNPLFLDGLNDALEKATNLSRLHALLARLSKVQVFDPACGSGNFLVIAFKELRKIEMQVLARISELSPSTPLQLSGISLANFYGIELVDFACETAKLSLWIAEYQMNGAFREMFGTAQPPLPLGKITTIHRDNALRANWLDVCPNADHSETFVCGNPPYQGARGQTNDQKEDIATVFSGLASRYGVIDYVACWYMRLAAYMSTNQGASGAFISTNSICQGEQVALLWPLLFSKSLYIGFAHTSFKWSNNASGNAGVTCIVVGLTRESIGKRRLFSETGMAVVDNITPYLTASSRDTVVTKSAVPLNGLPVAVKGSDATYSGTLMLTGPEKQRLVDAFPEAESLVRRFYGPHDFLYNSEQYVLWIEDDQLALARSIPPIERRLQMTQERRKGGGQNARRGAATPHRFVRSPNQDLEALIMPQVTSERRRYLQVGLLDARDIADNKMYVVYSPPSYLFALLSSRLHRLWAEAAGGRLETRLSYTNTLVYNTFPIPVLSSEQKRILAEHSRAILRARAKHPGKTIAWLYDPKEMPSDLLSAHQANDAFLEEYVYGRAFRDDTHRLEHLFAMYATMTEPKNDLPLLAAAAAAANAEKESA